MLDLLIASPIDIDTAIRITLINNPNLHTTYAALGFGVAELYQGSRIRNPVLKASVLESSIDGERDKRTFGLVASFTDVITLPARKRLAEGSFAALQQQVGAEILATVAETASAYYRYAAAQQHERLHAAIAEAGELSAALASRFQQAGNLSTKEVTTLRTSASRARLAALQAETATNEARGDLATQLGISVGGDWTVPALLPLPAAEEDELATLLELAARNRLDLVAARTRVEVRVDQLGVVNWTRWLGELDIGYERERRSGGGRLSGPSLAWELPLFSQHEDAMLRADTELQLAIIELRRLTMEADNSVRLARARLETARARVDEYRHVTIPAWNETLAFAQRELNFMLIGTFEAIALKQSEYADYEGYIAALRDYWLARTELALATGNAPAGFAAPESANFEIEALLRAVPAPSDHQHHEHTGTSEPERHRDKHDHHGHH